MLTARPTGSPALGMSQNSRSAPLTFTSTRIASQIARARQITVHRRPEIIERGMGTCEGVTRMADSCIQATPGRLAIRPRVSGDRSTPGES